MALQPGTWLNHYQILGHLGTGGMGEVYRALDNKLQREVALKVLPKAFAQDPERLARFRREAQVLAQLNHVNIAAIYSVEQSGETHFLVMELALGETLRDRIKKSPVPLEETLEICKQIAAGLEHAHEKPIVHRDLKPANIKVTPEGVVKILDFGLARAFAGDSGSGDPADSPTLSAMTAPGTILGTAAYMSPEQARGKKVDKRTDIWALGCVLYELLTGQQAFQSRHQSPDRKGGVVLNPRGVASPAEPPVADAPGSDENTIADIIGAVLYKEPDWTALPATTPSNVRVLLRRCLEKEAKRRYSSATDLQIQIEEALSAPATAAPSATLRAPARPVGQRALPSVLACLVVAALTGIAIWNLRTPEPRPITRTAITLPNNVALASLDVPAVAISPDGSHLAYVGSRGGTRQLYLRALDSLEAEPIEGTEEASMPFFSPDGQWLGFFAGTTLKKISVTGGAAVTLSNFIGSPLGASWGTDDIIVFGAFGSPGLSQVSAAGGVPRPLTTPDSATGQSGWWPQLLPGGRAVLFTVRTPIAIGSFDEAPIEVQELRTGERKVLVQGGTYGRYVPTGHLAYVRSGTLMAAPFDLKRLEVTGPAVPIVEGVWQSLTGGAQFSISDQGSLVYIPGRARGAQNNLVWVDRKGVEQSLAAPPRPYYYPRLSPDGRMLAVDTLGDIWVYDIPRGTLSRLTFGGVNNLSIWSPDGKRIAFSSARDGKPLNLFWKPADGSGPEERLTTSEHSQNLHSWSPDGQVIAFIDTDATTGLDLWTLPLSGERKPRMLLRTPFFEGGPKFSPDGNWIAYASNESGRFEIYVQPFPGPGGKWQISIDGGTEPLWARNGELFYRNSDRMMAVETKTQPTFSAGTPRLLFEQPYERGGGPGATNYDVSADGQRIVMIKAAGPEGGAPTQIHVVLNWFEELKRRVPAAR